MIEYDLYPLIIAESSMMFYYLIIMYGIVFVNTILFFLTSYTIYTTKKEVSEIGRIQTQTNIRAENKM